MAKPSTTQVATQECHTKVTEADTTDDLSPLRYFPYPAASEKAEEESAPRMDASVMEVHVVRAAQFEGARGTSQTLPSFSSPNP
ncbi:hypothetical protein G7K_6186-t1 [Saitoella complicata NRRL Y-17804]|uniref:Uncharacterized protein n=1 Tax=Saitoella complicata (strain BCRC 22490 / CBS 7301 / JCM 7358 / NBRC 10748 / NRRL Y-17804) TaxID=698492 RepID=A0A0E9NRP9_SAICN|nr:hypothetical protein G7K_6186-t1 [Saitoella complicata NRRL Y-17804]